MKNLLFCLLLIAPFSLSFGQYNPVWTSYFGNDSTKIVSLVYDSVSHYIYIAGLTNAQSGISTPGAHQPQLSTPNGWGVTRNDLFLEKFDTSGHRIWGTYYGGSGDELGGIITLDKFGNIYLCGATNSDTGIATPGSFMPTAHYAKAFLVKFNPDGQRLWGTYYGSITGIGLIPLPPEQVGIGPSLFPRVVCDADGNVYLAGTTTDRDNISTPGAYQPNYLGPDTFDIMNNYLDGFLVKFSPTGQRLWGTYLGGWGSDIVWGLNIDKDNSLYVTGHTGSYENIATAGTFVPTPDSVLNYLSGFVMKFDSSGGLVWGTYTSALASTYAASSQPDEEGNVYVLGVDNSSLNVVDTIATVGTHQDTKAGMSDLFLLKLDSLGRRVWCTYLGGPNEEGFYPTGWISPLYLGYGVLSISRESMAIDPTKNTIYLVAGTESSTGIATECGYNGKGAKKSLVAAFNTTDGTLRWSSYHDAYLQDLALDRLSGALYLAGWTGIDGLGTPGAFQETKVPGKNSGYLGKVNTTVFCETDTLHIIDNDGLLSVDTTGLINYRWFRDGQLVQSGSDSTFDTHGGISGNYYVIGYNNCGCSFGSDSVWVDVPTGIANPDRAHNFSISPNPTRNLLKISGQLNAQATLHYEIVDALGRKILMGIWEINGSFSKNIDVEKWPAGLYYLRLFDGKMDEAFKFVKE